MSTSEQSCYVNSQMNMDHYQYFSAFSKGNEVNLDLEVLQAMLKHDLHINTNILDDQLVTVLPYMLAYYIKNWPGWKLLKNVLDFNDHFQQFRQYLFIKINYLIKNGYQYMITKLQEDNELILNQTDNILLKDVAPFKICIECPPKMMGSLVFIESGGTVKYFTRAEIFKTENNYFSFIANLSDFHKLVTFYSE